MASRRFGVKQSGQDIAEWFFATTKEKAGFFGTVGSKYHLTWLEEDDARAATPRMIILAKMTFCFKLTVKNE